MTSTSAELRAAKKAGNSSSTTKFCLLSPNDTSCIPLVYHWPLDLKPNYDPWQELIATIEQLSKEKGFCEYFGANFQTAMTKVQRDRKLGTKSLPHLRQFVDEYNNSISDYHQNETAESKQGRLRQVTTSLLLHMMSMIYSRSVVDPAKLNRYKAFSEEVYGEFSSSMISEIVKNVPIKPTDRFIDLGSGVGQVVLQVAAEGMCISSFGVEKQEAPARYASDMGVAFKKIMKWFGKAHGKFDIRQGDFLDEEFRLRIQEADVIFVNNYAFGTRLNEQLKERFGSLKEGTRIVSSLNFSPLSFTISERTLHDIGCFLSVRKKTCTGEGVSWTSTPFDYYIHTVDHSMMHEYFTQGDRKCPIRASLPDPEPEPTHHVEDAPTTKKKKQLLEKVKPPSRKRGNVRPPSLGELAEMRRSNACDLDLKMKSTIHQAVAELDVKATQAEQHVEDLEETVEFLEQQNGIIRTEITKESTERMAEIAGRLPGYATFKGTKYEHQVHLAIDVVANNHIWDRVHRRLQAETKDLQRQRDGLKAMHTTVVPRVQSLSNLIDFLNIGDGWIWNATFNPTPDNIKKVKHMLEGKQVSSATSSTSSSPSSSSVVASRIGSSSTIHTNNNNNNNNNGALNSAIQKTISATALPNTTTTTALTQPPLITSSSTTSSSPTTTTTTTATVHGTVATSNGNSDNVTTTNTTTTTNNDNTTNNNATAITNNDNPNSTSTTTNNNNNNNSNNNNINGGVIKVLTQANIERAKTLMKNLKHNVGMDATNETTHTHTHNQSDSHSHNHTHSQSDSHSHTHNKTQQSTDMSVRHGKRPYAHVSGSKTGGGGGNGVATAAQQELSDKQLSQQWVDRYFTPHHGTSASSGNGVAHTATTLVSNTKRHTQPPNGVHTPHRVSQGTNLWQQQQHQQHHHQQQQQQHQQQHHQAVGGWTGGFPPPHSHPHPPHPHHPHTSYTNANTTHTNNGDGHSAGHSHNSSSNSNSSSSYGFSHQLNRKLKSGNTLPPQQHPRKRIKWQHNTNNNANTNTSTSTSTNAYQSRGHHHTQQRDHSAAPPPPPPPAQTIPPPQPQPITRTSSSSSSSSSPARTPTTITTQTPTTTTTQTTPSTTTTPAPSIWIPNDPREKNAQTLPRRRVTKAGLVRPAVVVSPEQQQQLLLLQQQQQQQQQLYQKQHQQQLPPRQPHQSPQHQHQHQHQQRNGLSGLEAPAVN